MTLEHIFFDLDHTLWDFDRNAHETLSELYLSLDLGSKLNTDVDSFILKYKAINDEQWAMYRKGQISKEVMRTSRYLETFKFFKYDDVAFAEMFGKAYLENMPIKTHLCDGCIELLDALKPKYTMHIITNGFEEVQPIKMKSSGIEHYFEVLMSSERANCKKPGPEIFLQAMKEAGAKPYNSLMVGDNYEADVVGAENAGIKAVLYDPNNDYEDVKQLRINHLSQLLNLI